MDTIVLLYVGAGLVFFAYLSKVPWVKRPFRNFFGYLNGYGSCPNCGDRWNWKQRSRIIYEDACCGPVGVSRGVAMCTECLGKPSSLNPERISQKLRKCNWDQAKIKLAHAAVVRFKREKIPCEPATPCVITD